MASVRQPTNDSSPQAEVEVLTLDQPEPQQQQQTEKDDPKLEQQLPENWPKDITYLTEQTYSAAVTADQRSALSRTTEESESYPRIPKSQVQFPSPNVTVTVITQETHPARGQRGLFAAVHLPPDSFICLYVGHVHQNSLSDTDPHSDYDLSYDRDIGLSVDASHAGNESRCANDYRGIAERPNAEFRDCMIRVPSEKRVGGTKWERRVGIFVLSAGKAGLRKAGIAAGQEILVNYGKSFWEARKTVAKFRKDEQMLKIANAALDA